MSLVHPLIAVACGLVLFVLPGTVFLTLVAPRRRDLVTLDEALYLAVAISAAVSAWTALLLAEVGAFSLVTAAGLLFAVSLLALVLGRRHAGWPWPRRTSLRACLAPLAVAGLAFALQARPSEYIVGGRDPGAYVAAMGLIGRTGTLAWTDPVVLSIPPEDRELFFRHPEMPAFSWTRILEGEPVGQWSRFMGFDLEHPGTGRVVPQFFHLFPAFGAYLFQAMGVRGALATPPLFGILGTLGVFFALRRTLGPAPALLASLLLGTNVLQVWFARYPVSEPMSQFLIFLGLFAIALWEQKGSAAFAALAGTALGLTLLVRIDSVLILLPLAGYLVVRRAIDHLPWRNLLPLLIPFAVLTVHATLHTLFFATKYAHDIGSRRYWTHPAWVWVAAVAAGLLLVAAAKRLGLRAAGLIERHGASLRDLLAVAGVLLALYAYAVRPSLSAWAGGDGNARGLVLADPRLVTAPVPGTAPYTVAEEAVATGRSASVVERRLILLRVLRGLGYHRLAAHDAQAFLRLGWFVTPLGLILVVLGLVVVLKEGRREHLFPLLTALVFAGFYFYKIRVFNDYFFAMRRFLPVILPWSLGLAALFLCRLASRGGVRRFAALGLTLALFGVFARDTAAIARYVDWAGAVRFVADVARRFGPEDVVLFEQPKSIHLLSLPLWAEHGVNALQLARFDPDPARLQHLVRAWGRQYRNIYFVHSYRTDLCGLFLERVETFSFGTHEWELTYDRPPRSPAFRSVHFTLSRFVNPEDLRVPPLDDVDIGSSDDVQVSGFFEKERAASGDRTYRWTGACGSVYLPGAVGAETLTLVASSEGRPADRPAEVKVSLSGIPVGEFVAGTGWEDHALRLPRPLPSGPPILRLDVSVFRPANVDPSSADERDLGVRLDRILLSRSAGGSGAAAAAGVQERTATSRDGVSRGEPEGIRVE